MRLRLARDCANNLERREITLAGKLLSAAWAAAKRRDHNQEAGHFSFSPVKSTAHWWCSVGTASPPGK